MTWTRTAAMVASAAMVLGASCRSLPRAGARGPVIVWQPSHQTDTGTDFSEAAVSNGIVEAAMRAQPSLRESKVWSLGVTGLHHADAGSNTVIAHTVAITDGQLSGYAYELREANARAPEVFIAVHNNGGTNRHAVWGYVHDGDRYEAENRALAARLIAAIAGATDLENRGVLLDSSTGRNDYRCEATGRQAFYSLDEHVNHAPYRVLLEIGDNAVSKEFLKNPANQRIIGEAIKRELAAWLASRRPPVVDYHQHLFSPAAAALTSGDPRSPGINARDVVALLDSAHIQRALVLSVAYTWGKASRAPVPDEYAHVKAENDWTAQQVAQFPERLRAFCSVNPLKSYALDEVTRCHNDPHLRSGLKLHFGNSDVDLDDPIKVAETRRVIAAANGYGMALVVHMRPSLDLGRKYGAAQARVFLDQLLAAAPDVPVQIAHLAGSGDYGAETDSALAVFTDAIARKDPRMRRVWFDATTVVRAGMSPAALQQIADRIRQLGVARVLYGSDAAASAATYPRAGWELFTRLPLTTAEFGVIAGNVAPYMREQR